MDFSDLIEKEQKLARRHYLYPTTATVAITNIIYHWYGDQFPNVEGLLFYKAKLRVIE